ncbi:amidohydrolase family protein [Blastopirellula marina]|uniref:Amidohydrolase n=1 Tax=Blastopirellula marina TaxID=124 RepID=A0A2S8G0G6_9BACT|nr:amidohydrolase family protein [Blastopirellula marina]PQO37939.1 amidohydrolase [Blastopirellula marina]PTL44595.1 amidohydrolase [Blastopirellula marina]
MPTATPSIIDTHQHLWDLETLKLPWLNNAGPPLAAQHWTQQYAAETQGLDIQAAMYMEVDAAADQKQREADTILELISSGKSNTRYAILSADPGKNGFRKFVDQFRDNEAVKGFRQVLHGGSTPAGYCLTPKFIENCRYLGQLGKTFDLCLRPKELKDAARLAEACPQTRFVLDHCGNADPKAFFASSDSRRGTPAHDADKWRQDMATLAEQENLCCKISGIVARVPGSWSPDDLRPIVQHCADAFGDRRIVFGSDWPVCKLGASLKEWVAALTEIIAPWPPSAQSRLWRENATTVYQI